MSFKDKPLKKINGDNHKLSEEFKKGSIRNLCYVNIKKNKM